MKMKPSSLLTLCTAALVAVAIPVLAASPQTDSPAVDQPREECGGGAEANPASDGLVEVPELAPMTPLVGSTDPEALPEMLPEPKQMQICEWRYREVYNGCCAGIRAEFKKQRIWCCEITGCDYWRTYDTYCSNYPC